MLLVLLMGVAIIRLRQEPAAAGSTLTIILTPKGLTPTHTPSAPITISIAQGAQQIFTTTIAPVNNTATVDLPTNVSSIVSDLQVTLSSPLWTKMSFTVSGGLSGRSITTGSLFYGDMNKDGTLTTADLVLAILCRRNSAACPAEMSGTPLTLANLVTIVRLSRTAIIAPTISAPVSSVAASSASSASSVAPVAAGSVHFPHATGGDKAKEFFLKFQNRDPNKLDVDFSDYVDGRVDTIPGGVGWYWSPWGASGLALKVDANGRHYLQSRGGDRFLDWGIWWLQYFNQDVQFSNDYPSALAANRLSFLIRAPDQVIDPSGRIFDVRTDPVGYSKVIAYYKGNYQQADGYGRLDWNPENDDWHFYSFQSDYWDHEKVPVKVEYLGNQFQRITFNQDHSGTRNSNHFGVGIFGPTDPDLAAFVDDIFTKYRSQTRLYFQQQAPVGTDFVKTGDTSGDPVAAGERVIQYYGASHWYEDDGVELLAYPTNNPGGTPFVQMAVNANGSRYVDIPFTLKNTQNKSSAYWLSLGRYQIPIFEPASAAADEQGTLVYEDTNMNGVLDSAEITGKRMGATVRNLAQNEILHGIIRLDSTKMVLDSNESRAITIRVKDPADPMSLKGASIKIQTVKTSNPANVCEDNIFFFPGPSFTSACPANQVPIANLQISLNGRVLSAGDTVTVGDTLLIKSLGVDPDAGSNALKVTSHRIFFPDGTSTNVNLASGTSYKPSQSGENMFLLEVADGKARAYQSLKITVVQAPNVPPKAKINLPSATDLRAGDRIPFSAFSSLADNYDPDGGAPGTMLGITRFAWDFGDGQTVVNNRSPFHVFAAAGNYTVKLTVTDDEGSTATAQKVFTILAANFPPVADICVSSPSLVQQFGAIELSAACSTDPNGFDDIKLFRWKFTAPNGFTETSDRPMQPNPRFVIPSAWEAGDYTVSLDVWDSREAHGHIDKVIRVPAWQGTIRINTIGVNGGPGQSFDNYDLRKVLPGWTLAYSGVGFNGQAPIKMGIFGGKVVSAVPNTNSAIRNNSVPVGTPDDLVPVLMSSTGEGGWGGANVMTISNLPPGKYQVTAYMYWEDHKDPGTEYKVGFGNLVLGGVIPANATIKDFTFQGTLNHAGGDLAVVGFPQANRPATGPFTPLNGFTITPVP